MLHANNIVRNIVHTVPLARPTIVLMGGVSGSGKSTLARQLAREHGADVLSSDTIRAALQAVLPYAAAPALHHSSFDVWRTLTTTPGPRDILAGFCKQAELLAPALRGAMERAVLERRSLVVEGVHAIPGLLPMTLLGAQMLTVFLTVSSERDHRHRFMVREAQTRGARSAKPYLDQFTDLRTLQENLEARAYGLGVPVVDSDAQAALVLHHLLMNIERRPASALNELGSVSPHTFKFIAQLSKSSPGPPSVEITDHADQPPSERGSHEPAHLDSTKRPSECRPRPGSYR